MKFSSQTLRTFTTLHTWVGLVAGFALFVAFYAGALTLFHHDLPLWQTPHAVDTPAASLDDAQRLLDGVLERHPAARTHVGMTFPGGDHPQPIAYWQDAQGTWLYAWLDHYDGSVTPPQTGLAELVNELHYSLGLPVAGTYLMGIVSLLYGVALLSGLVIHLPKLLGDLFALRPGRNLKQMWQDAHNVIGVLSLPFHLMFAVTGALLCLIFLQMAALNPLIFDGKLLQAVPAAMDTAPVREPSGQPGDDTHLRMLHARAIEVARAQGVADFEPAFLKLAHAGDANATIEITGESGGTLGPLGAVGLDAATGRLLSSQLPGQRDANHATLSAAYALHFGEFGNGVWCGCTSCSAWAAPSCSIPATCCGSNRGASGARWNRAARRSIWPAPRWAFASDCAWRSRPASSARRSWSRSRRRRWTTASAGSASSPGPSAPCGRRCAAPTRRPANCCGRRHSAPRWWR